MKNEETDINGKISVKKQQINVEQDPVTKARLQKELQILNFRKEINFYKDKIKQIKNSMIVTCFLFLNFELIL